MMGFIIYDITNLPATNGGPVEFAEVIAAHWTVGLRSLVPHVYEGDTSGYVIVYWHPNQSPQYDVSAEALQAILRRKYPAAAVTIQKSMLQ